MEQSQKRQDMIKAAKLYYYGNMSQDTIAEMLGISRPKVSRLLAEARKIGIVKIEVSDPNFSYKYQDNAERIRDYFHLLYVKIVPSGADEDIAKTNVGRAASDFLNDHIHETSHIGLSWGTTLASFAREFRAKASYPNACVVQLVGGTYSQSMNIDARELVKTISGKLQCKYSLLQGPMIVHNPALRDLLMQEPAVIEHFHHIHELDMAFVGIGKSHDRDSVVLRANYIAEDEAYQLYQLGMVCDICGHQLKADGSSPHTFLSNRVFGISLEELRNVPLVMGLCVGHKKTEPLLAALRGKYLTGIIIDEVAAISLISAIGL